MKISSHGLWLALSPVSPLTDEDWCRVMVKAVVPGFEANFAAWLQGADLRRFRREMQTMYAAVGAPTQAVLGSFEPGISITLSMRNLGSVVGTYKFQGDEFVEGGPPVLEGGFHIDQSYLPLLIADVDELLQNLGAPHEA